MRGTERLTRSGAGCWRVFGSAVLLTTILVLAGPSLPRAERAIDSQPLDMAFEAGGSKSVRFIMADGRTIIGRVIKIDDEVLLIRRPSAGLTSLPLTDIVTAKIKSSEGRLIPGRITRLTDGRVGWTSHANADDTEHQVASRKVAAASETGGPLIRLEGQATAPESDVSNDAETVEGPVELAALSPKDEEPAAGASFAPKPIALEVTTDGASEGDKLVYFRMKLSEPPPRPILIIYTMISGTATSPADYDHRQGVVVFEPDQTQAVIATSISNDDVVEGPEDFHFFVTGDPTSVTIEHRNITATIADDDG